MPIHSLANEALRRLAEGNRRYVANQAAHPNATPGRRAEVAQGQKPLAMILGCADSRVPPELIFDCGLGDLFVVRTAGHVLDSAVLGSLEYGVVELQIPLLIVLGHEQCGAVKATLEAIGSEAAPEGEIGRLVAAIRPAAVRSWSAPGNRLDNAVRANVELAIERLNSSARIADALQAGALRIIGARYGLTTGLVELMEKASRP
jgi:carbonic anhydrase